MKFLRFYLFLAILMSFPARTESNDVDSDIFDKTHDAILAFSDICLVSFPSFDSAKEHSNDWGNFNIQGSLEQTGILIGLEESVDLGLLVTADTDYSMCQISTSQILQRNMKTEFIDYLQYTFDYLKHGIEVNELPLKVVFPEGYRALIDYKTGDDGDIFVIYSASKVARE